MDLGGKGSGAGRASVQCAGGALAKTTREKVGSRATTGAGSTAAGPAHAKTSHAGMPAGFICPGCRGQFEQGWLEAIPLPADGIGIARVPTGIAAASTTTIASSTRRTCPGMAERYCRRTRDSSCSTAGAAAARPTVAETVAMRTRRWVSTIYRYIPAARTANLPDGFQEHVEGKTVS
jgi:hypothetical protein